MVNFLYKTTYDVQDLMHIVSILRGPEGCPWDQVQTHQSIRRDFLEEVYEVAEAIDQDDRENLKEELGDVLLQVVFHTLIEQERSGLTLDEVADGVCKKLIYRHPHVFGEVTVSGTGEVLNNWEALKRVEKGQVSHADALRAVARALPALWRAEKVQKKAEKAGYGWSDESARRDEVLRCGQKLECSEDSEQTLGQLLFAVVNLARAQGIDPEQALGRATDEFIDRFARTEAGT